MANSLSSANLSNISKILEKLDYGVGPKESLDLAKEKEPCDQPEGTTQGMKLGEIKDGDGKDEERFARGTCAPLELQKEALHLKLLNMGIIFHGEHKWIYKDHNGVFRSYVKGEWKSWKDDELVEYKNSDVPEALGSVYVPAAEHISYVFGAAKDAQIYWEQSNWLRSTVMHKISDNLQKYQRLVTVVETLASGIHLSQIRDIVVPYVIQSFRYYSGWAMLKDAELQNWQPMKVVFVLVAEGTVPLLSVCRKICPALAMGSTVVVIPSAGASLSCMLLADICSISGLPAGVLNIFPSTISALSATKSLCTLADKLVICDAPETCLAINFPWYHFARQVSASGGHHVTTVVFETSDLASATASVAELLCNQIDLVTRKVYVQEEIYEKFWDLLCFHLSKVRVGTCFDMCSDVTPFSSIAEVFKISELLKDAQKEGAEMFEVITSSTFPATCICPCAVRNVQTSSRIVIELVRGPVMVVLPFRTAKEATALVNNCCYRQTVSIWTEKIPLALDIARQVKARSILVNTHNCYDPAAVLGGSQLSGNYSDGGKESLYEYLVPIYDNLPGNTGLEIRPRFDWETTVLGYGEKAYKLYYGGACKEPESSTYWHIPVGDENVLVALASAKDLQSSVMSAQSAQSGWERKPARDRAQMLYRIAGQIKARNSEFANALHKTAQMSLDGANREVELSVQSLMLWSAYCDKHGGSIQETSLNGIVAKLNEAVGVIGITCPSSHPLLAFVTLMGAAVAKGNTVVILPSEEFPIPALNMIEVLDVCAVPPGVINILTGSSLLEHMVSNCNISALWTHVAFDWLYHNFDVKAIEKLRIFRFSEGRNWEFLEEAHGDVLLYHSTKVKSVWMPSGDIFAN